MHSLEGTIRDYAWGSRLVIAQLQGRPTPSPRPEAELWLGGHDGGPATVDLDGTPVTLDALLAADPDRWLGAAASARFGNRLPFLLKVLAPERPLSLQAHPDAEQARAGYAAEEAAGVHHNYVDPYHKPELLVALTPFEALCGFREPAISADVLAELGIDALAPVVAALRSGVAGLGEAVRTLLTWPEAERLVVESAVQAAGKLSDIESAALLQRLAGEYPGDRGVLVALLLNHVHLAPGEAIWMPPGNLHAYLSGCGVEILAASDNVLRGGLTPKRVDVPELLRVLRFQVLAEPVVAARQVAPGVVTWPAPVDDFALYGVRLDGGRVDLDPPGPRVVLCVEGRLEVRDGSDAVTLGRGQAAFGAAAAGPLTLVGDGEAFVASLGRG
ncbi:MAG TPA: mannose-6-phosphate isomerase, class I [Micromonosporaceae bacterium]|nr:mannose-6-phosphate isomerase, class I [Micromonosporaceae bacterium]